MPQKTVLFIDDEIVDESEGHFSYMSYYLHECENCGFAVEKASDVSTALNRLQHGRPVDVAVLDLLMPSGPELPKGEISGYSIARILKERHPLLPVVVLSNAETLAPVEKLRKLPNVKVILYKTDVSPTRLVAAMTEILGLDGDSPATSHADDSDNWKAVIDGEKQATFAKFLSQPDLLTASEFLLLSEINHKLIRQLVSVAQSSTAQSSEWLSYSPQQLAAEIALQTDIHRKGRILEELALRLFNGVPGFRAKSRLRTETEELDIFILNGSMLAPWRDMGPVMIGECKNWSTKCGVPEYNHFETKIRDLHGQCKCGFFLSWNGFTADLINQCIRTSRENFLVLLLQGDAITSAAMDDRFADLIERSWEVAVTR